MSKVTLGEVAAERRETLKISNAKYGIVGLDQLPEGELLLTDWGKSEVDSTFTKVFRMGDVLFGRRRAYLKKAVISPFDGICSGDITVIKPNTKKLYPALLPFIIQNESFFDFAVGRSAGSLSPRAKWKDIQCFSFNLPDSMEEQRKLAAMLWSIVRTRQAYKRLLQKTDELVKSQFIEMFGDPISNNKSWREMPLSKVCENILGGGTPSKKHIEYYKGSIPWVTPKDMKDDFISDSLDHITIEAIENSTAKLVPPKSVLMVIRSGVLKHDLPIAINIVPVTINQDLKAFVCGDKIRPEFLWSYFKAIETDILNGVRSVTADNIDFKVFQQRSIILPPLSLQDQYMAFIQQADKSKFALKQAMEKLDMTYKKLISENLG